MRLRSAAQILFVLSAFSLVACSNSSNSVVSDSLRSTSDSKTVFTSDKQEMKLKSLDSDELSTILLCDKPSTAKRLDTKKYSIIKSITVRNKKTGFERPMTVEAFTVDYKTDNEGETYTSGYQLQKLMVEKESALTAGQVGYIDTCTQSKGCDTEKRIYTAGTAKRLVQARQRFRRLGYTKSKQVEMYGCTYETDDNAEVIDDQIQEGTVGISGVARKAVRITKMANVKIVCDGIETGKGQMVSREIILADRLPHVDREELKASIGCQRTKVFQGASVYSEGKLLYGSSVDLQDYVVVGEVMSIKEWEAEQEKIRATKKQLQSAVEAAKLRRDEAKDKVAAKELKASEKETAYLEADSAATTAKNKADAVDADPNATDDERKEARQLALNKATEAAQAKVIAEAAQREVQQAKNALASAENSLEAAELTLAKFKAENPQA